MKKGILFAAVCWMTAILLAGCGGQQDKEASTYPEPLAQEQYERLLAGDCDLLEAFEEKGWWVPDFQQEMEYEYVYMDLDQDAQEELVVRMADNPGGYNGVFHFADGRLICWNSDGTEMSGRDYPLQDGTMVRQYDWNGTQSYTLFHYQSDGEIKELENLFVRRENIPEDSTQPCPYYEVNGKEVEQSEFEAQLQEKILDRLLQGDAWTAL